jgi:hypothetical protein
MKDTRYLIPIIAGAVLVACMPSAHARHISVEIEIHRLRGEELASLKKIQSLGRKERNKLFMDQQDETSKLPEEAYKEKRAALLEKERLAKHAFLAKRKPDVSDALDIRLGVPFETKLRFGDKDFVFAGKTQSESSLYWPTPDHVPSVIPCRHKITYGDRVLRASWGPGSLAMGSWLHQLEHSEEERVYLVMRKRFVKTRANRVDSYPSKPRFARLTRSGHS